MRPLDNLTESNGLVSIEAKYTLLEWKEGNLILDYLDYKIDWSK
ncbi:hypothetical protein OKW21_005857 [Catalinimonas alkaloidigena]|nr:hypothetical protein [Catalinimonas alkaloidigena]